MTSTPPTDVTAVFDSVTPRYPELAGQVAVVTGAAKGIGQGIATRLAAEGMRVVLADLDRGALTATTTGLRNHGADVLDVHGDVGRPDDVDALFEKVVDTHGTVDALVNNAADLRRRRLLDDHDELLDHQLATNVRGPYQCSQRAAAIMRDGGGGSIVHISSVGALRAHHWGFPYDVTKGAVNAMTLAMALDLGGYGIRVNAIAPGVTHTYRTDPYRAADPDSYQTTAERIPLGRWGTVADIAAMAAFLVSPESSYITGQIIPVDGGITAQLTPRGPEGLESFDRLEHDPKGTT